MKKNKKKDFDKIKINDKHIEMFNITLESVEILLNKFSKEIKEYNENPIELSKNIIATLDFYISALSKIQKGQRLALNLDKDTPLENTEPQINIIEGLDYKKI